MKIIVALLALATASQTVHAQFIRPETAGGALLGGIAGAVIGNNSGDLGHNSWRGAAIGTVAGGLIGSAVGRSRDNYYSHEVPVPNARAHSSYGSRHASGYHGGYYNRYDRVGYYSPIYSSYREPLYYGSSYDRYPSGNSYNRASTGLLLGGIAGAIIGNNSGDLRHNAWRGAAIGAGSGWLLGTIADQRARARDREQSVVIQRESDAATTTQAPVQTVPQTVIINNNYYGTSSNMTSANSLFGR
jgi:uncharacterized protein YcfJ